MGGKAARLAWMESRRKMVHIRGGLTFLHIVLVMMRCSNEIMIYRV